MNHHQKCYRRLWRLVHTTYRTVYMAVICLEYRSLKTVSIWTLYRATWLRVRLWTHVIKPVHAHFSPTQVFWLNTDWLDLKTVWVCTDWAWQTSLLLVLLHLSGTVISLSGTQSFVCHVIPSIAALGNTLRPDWKHVSECVGPFDRGGFDNSKCMCVV